MTTARALGAFAALLAGCGATGEWPRFSVPQLEQARQSVEGGIGHRYEDHTACRKTAVDAKALVACMAETGWGYIPRSADPQATECWRLRDTNSTDPLPEALCFVARRPAAPR